MSSRLLTMVDLTAHTITTHKLKNMHMSTAIMLYALLTEDKFSRTDKGSVVHTHLK